MNRSITSTSNCEQKSPTNKSPGLHRWILSNGGGVTMPILIKHFQKHEGRNIPSSFCEAAITMNQNEAEMPHKEENCRLISLMNINAKILKKMLPKKKKTSLKGSYTRYKWGLSQSFKDSSLSANQSMWYTILTNWKVKTIR